MRLFPWFLSVTVATLEACKAKDANPDAIVTCSIDIDLFNSLLLGI